MNNDVYKDFHFHLDSRQTSQCRCLCLLKLLIIHDFFFLFWFDFMLFRETNERRLTIPIWLKQHFFDHFLNVRRSCCSCCWLRSNEPLAKLGTFARLFIIIITDCFCKSPFGKHFIKIQSISISVKCKISTMKFFQCI